MTGFTLTVCIVICAVLTVGSLLVAVRLLRGRRDPGGDRPQRPGRLRALGAVLRPGGEEELEDLKSRTTRAGLYGQDAVDLFLTVRLIVLLTGAGLILVGISWARSPLSAAMLALIIGGLAVVLPGMWLDRRMQQRHQAIAASLPETLELLVVCFRAGLGLDAALARIASTDDDAGEDDLLRRELRLVLADMRLGISVELAFRRFAARIGSEETSSLASVIAQSTRLGTQIGELLRAHAEKMRHQQLMVLEEQAGKASAKLSLPLTLCLLPAGMLLLLGPAFYVVLGSF